MYRHNTSNRIVNRFKLNRCTIDNKCKLNKMRIRLLKLYTVLVLLSIKATMSNKKR